ncbi:zinc finger protein-like protein [Anopheles sinensis]|uniref:Zinc finger protein-like protein n=1 Tax=Anopheles sinensis TaxID=74873 RepID=A0A084VPK1_ANOSI|nr:zinc finger protein-like protein [Anopheles sinensis]
METCVLIPQEFALAVTGVGARHSPEQTATVWSSASIPQGRLCYPFQGTVRIDNLAIFTSLPENDRVSSDCAHSSVKEMVPHVNHPPMTVGNFLKTFPDPGTYTSKSRRTRRSFFPD